MKFTLEPLGVEIIPTELPGTLSADQVRHLKRLIRSASSRCADTLRSRTLSELGTQLCLRALLLSQSTVGSELSALRNLVALMKSRRKACCKVDMDISPEATIPELDAVRPWMCLASWDEVEKFHSYLESASTRRLIDLGNEVIDSLIDHSRKTGDFRTQGDIWVSLASTAGRLSFGKRMNSPNDNWEPLTEKHMQEIDSHLPPGSPEEGLLSLNTGERNHCGIARLLTRTAWLTGTRSCEIFSCRLMESNPDAKLTHQQAKDSYRNPVPAIKAGLFRDIEKPCTQGGHETPLDESIHPAEFGFPEIFVIQTAKTANSSPKIDNALRVQILDGISREDFHVLWLASLFRTPQYSWVSKKSLCNMSTAS